MCYCSLIVLIVGSSTWLNTMNKFQIPHTPQTEHPWVWCVCVCVLAILRLRSALANWKLCKCTSRLSSVYRVYHIIFNSGSRHLIFAHQKPLTRWPHIDASRSMALTIIHSLDVCAMSVSRKKRTKTFETKHKIAAGLWNKSNLTRSLPQVDGEMRLE